MSKSKASPDTSTTALAAVRARYDAMIADAEARLAEHRHRVRTTAAEMAALIVEKDALPALKATPAPSLKAAAKATGRKHVE
jgi:hypothetical protein